MTTAASRTAPTTGGASPQGLGGAAIAVCAWSTGTILAKAIDMGGLAIGAYRFALFGLGAVVFMHLRGTPFRLRVIRDSMWGGLALAGDIAFFFSAVKLTSIVNATIIGSLQPIVVGVVAARFFGEHIRLRDAMWSLIALGGVIVVVLGSRGSDTHSLAGDLLAAAAMITWSAYFVASKESRKRLTPIEFTAGTAIWTAAVCTPLGVVFGQDMSIPTVGNWLLLVVMTLSSGVIGHALMNWSLVRIPLWVGSTFTLLIPVFSAALAWVFLGEPLRAVQALAMVVVIGALAMVVHGQRTPPVARPVPAEPLRDTP